MRNYFCSTSSRRVARSFMLNTCRPGERLSVFANDRISANGKIQGNVTLTLIRIAVKTRRMSVTQRHPSRYHFDRETRRGYFNMLHVSRPSLVLVAGCDEIETSLEIWNFRLYFAAHLFAAAVGELFARASSKPRVYSRESEPVDEC